MRNEFFKVTAVLPVWILVAVYAFCVINNYSMVDEPIDWVSVLSEGLIASMPALGLLIIANLRSQLKVFWPLFIGLGLMFLALTTDTLDEFVDIPSAINNLVEGGVQVVGFLLVLIGLFNWVRLNKMLTDQLIGQAATDPLTGIANRRAFLSTLKRDISMLERYPRELSVILFDIDHFKQINDTFGHDIGDEVLRQIGDRVSNGIRDMDAFARYGGEEFIIILTHTNANTAEQVAQKIRQIMRQIKVGNIDGVCASFGISQYREGEGQEALLNRADEAMYQAKRNGRDSIVNNQ